MRRRTGGTAVLEEHRRPAHAAIRARRTSGDSGVRAGARFAAHTPGSSRGQGVRRSRAQVGMRDVSGRCRRPARLSTQFRAPRTDPRGDISDTQVCPSKKADQYCSTVVVFRSVSRGDRLSNFARRTSSIEERHPYSASVAKEDPWPQRLHYALAEVYYHAHVFWVFTPFHP